MSTSRDGARRNRRSPRSPARDVRDGDRVAQQRAIAGRQLASRCAAMSSGSRISRSRSRVAVRAHRGRVAAIARRDARRRDDTASRCASIAAQRAHELRRRAAVVGRRRAVPAGRLRCVTRSQSGTFCCTSMPQNSTLSTAVSFEPPSLSTKPTSANSSGCLLEQLLRAVHAAQLFVRHGQKDRRRGAASRCGASDRRTPSAARWSAT